jgi:hypothetical protein
VRARNNRRDNGPAAAVELDDLPDPAALAVDQLLTELAGVTDATVTVYRILSGTEQRGSRAPVEYLCKYPAEGFSLDVLRDAHGGGDFRLYINAGDGQIIRKLSVSVVRAPPAPAPAPAAAAPGVDLVAALREGFAQQAQLLREALRPPPPAIDMPALLTATARMITELRGAVAPPAAAAAPAPDMLGRMDSLLSIFQKGLDIGREAASPDEGGIMGLVKELIKSPLIDAAAKQIATGGAVPLANPAPAVTAAAPARPAPIPNAPGVPGAPTQGEQMRFYLAQLVRKAHDNADPTLYAAYIVDNVPEPIVRGFIERADWFEELTRVHPPVANYRAWFEELHAALIEELTPDMSVDTNAGLTDPPGASNTAPDDASGSAADQPG